MNTNDVIENTNNRVIQQLDDGINLWFCLADDFDGEQINNEMIELNENYCGACVIIAGVSESLLKYLVSFNLKEIYLLVNPDCYNIAVTYAQYNKVRLRNNVNVGYFVPGKQLQLNSYTEGNLYFTPWNYGTADNYLETEIEYRAKKYTCAIGNRKLAEIQSKGYFTTLDRFKKLDDAMKKCRTVFVSLDLSDFDGVKEIYRVAMANNFIFVTDIFYTDILMRINYTFPHPMKDRCMYTILNGENPCNAFYDAEFDKFTKNLKPFRTKDFICLYRKMDIYKEEFRYVYIVRPDMIDDLDFMLMYYDKEDVKNSAFVLASNKNHIEEYDEIIDLFNSKGINIIY